MSGFLSYTKVTGLGILLLCHTPSVTFMSIILCRFFMYW